MRIYKKTITLKSTAQVEFIDITERINEVIEGSNIATGQVLIYSPHTSAGIVVNHNETMLIQDFMRVLYRLIPINDKYSHDIFELSNINKSDGRSNGHAHCKSMLVGISETVPLEKGRMLITEKQSIFLVEFDGSRTRDVIVQVMGI